MICTDITPKHGNILVCKVTLKSSLRENFKQLTNASIPFYLGDCYPINTVSYRAAHVNNDKEKCMFMEENTTSTADFVYHHTIIIVVPMEFSRGS